MNPNQLHKLSELVIALKSKVKCPVCLDYVEDTAELQCSHRLCAVCLSEIKSKNYECPLCKTQITKRSPIYKDRFADELSKFTNRTCQLIKEKYAQEVEALFAKKANLQNIIETAPQDVPEFDTSNIQIPEASIEKPSDDALEKLVPNPKKCYTNKSKKTDRLVKNKLLSFDSDSTRVKIMNWLNDNQHTLDILTQSPQFIGDDDGDFEMPSISQLNSKRKQRLAKQRSQSLTEDDNLPTPLLKRYQSLAEGLNETDNYNIEDVHSETLVKQVERKVLQDMLEDECLANFEQAAQMAKQRPKRTPSKRKSKTAPAEIKSNVANSEASSGWERIKNVKKTLNKASKEPKKLNISVQGKNRNRKTSPKRNSGGSFGEKTEQRTKMSPKGEDKTTENKENHHENVKATKENPNNGDKNTFNLSTVENYFETHMSKIKVTPTKDTSSDIEIDITDEKKTKRQDDNDRSDEDEIFLLPTQKTPHSSNQQNSLCHISPIPTNFNDINSVAIRLSDNLKSCLSSATNLHGDIGQQLVSCFMNLLTYADKIIHIISDKNLAQAQASTKAASTQTGTHVNNVAIQTVAEPNKILSNKLIQTSQNTRDVRVQSEAPAYVNREIQTVAVVQVEESVEEIDNEKRLTPYLYSQSLESVRKEGSANTRSSKKKSNKRPVAGDQEKGVISGRNSQRSNATKELPVTVDDSKKDKTQNSIVLCSLASSKDPETKVNRKLTFGGSQNRKFKRIRKPATDSDSDEGESRSKKKFIRDDLTVEFVDSDKQLTRSNYSENKGNATPESERMDYDKYLLEIMNKYDDSPPSKKAKQKIDASSNPKNKSQIVVDANNQSQTKKTQSSPLVQKEKLKTQKDVDNGDHVFTGIIDLQENLDKFDQEILEYERATKAFSTELDLVENTPIASPKPKMCRLSKKKKDCMAHPLQIISKGSASSDSTSKKSNIATQKDDVANPTEDPSILNRNLEGPPSQTNKCTEDVADILKDLEKDDDFFSSNFEGTEADRHSANPSRKLENNGDDAAISFQEKPGTRESIDKLLANLDDFDDEDDEIDEELKKISFTAAQQESNGERVQILQDIKLRSQSRRNKETDPDAVIDSTDVSDEEIVETTPQKKRLSSNDRSLFETINELENPEGNDDLVVYLPPPPGFGDECATESQVENQRNSLASQKENFPGNKSSLTPDRLTDFIVTPDDRPHHTQKQESQCSLTFKPIFTAPSRPAQGKANASKGSNLINLENIFSPIAKTSIKFTQNNFTPLVPLSRFSSKKSNLMTSTPNQKSILNYVVPSQESTSVLSQKTKPCIMWSRILNKDLNIFTQLECKKLLTTSKVFGPQVTHLVVLVDEKGQIVSHTAKILQAIAAGIWVVRYEWAEDCLKMNRIVAEEPYEALDSTGVPGPRTARLSRATKPLFRGFKFYCAPPLKTVSKGDLEIILQLSGGEIANDLGAMLQNDGKVRIVLTESSATEETEQYDAWLDVYKVVTVDVEWLTNCISQYKLMSFRPFLIAGDESTVCDLGYPPTLLESVPYTLTEGV